MTELKPCPFCGGIAIETNEQAVCVHYAVGEAVFGSLPRVSCFECSALVTRDTMEEAVSAWNRRANG